jgi:glycosyltransferase involved in cell wall biosynthesis
MHKSPAPTIDVAIPVLNEERVLAASVTRVLEHVDHSSIEATITIADNGSTDGTQAIARSLAASDARVRYLRLDRPALGAALQMAWSTAVTPIIGYMDADLATDLRHLDETLPLLAGGACDMVVATRLAPGARVVNRSPLRTVTSLAYNAILRRRLRYPGSDAACGFKFLTRAAWDRIQASGRLSDGLFFGSEIAVRAFASGIAVREIPVQWTDERDSRIRVVPSTIDFWREMGRLRGELTAPSQAPRRPKGS